MSYAITFSVQWFQNSILAHPWWAIPQQYYIEYKKVILINKIYKRESYKQKDWLFSKTGAALKVKVGVLVGDPILKVRITDKAFR